MDPGGDAAQFGREGCHQSNARFSAFCH
ncbi:hypothetical protein PanWU01x14_001550 [Parasponia andersonii]|uniref:Uncharacterized protein n=1 Tax=Parasponia andersonii TaxID=3476 RepID=A0A2P5E501_PARAD|nr:hypothetical protein PanWU01x14_001550 [Parasponia andersonii]